jgi:carboxymethylenebutenolidase
MPNQMVTFPSNGGTAEGYLATPAAGSGPGMIVIQEWWGLNDNIKDIANRFAAEGFVALAPDLYHGQITAEPDEAGKLMMAMKMDQAAKDMSGAYDYLKQRPECSGKVGSVGFCLCSQT